MLAGTERLRLYACGPGRPVPVFLPGFDAEDPLPVVAGDTPELLGAVQDDRAQAFLLDHLVNPALPSAPPARLQHFFEHLHLRLARAGYLDRALESLIVVPPPLAAPDRCDAVVELVSAAFEIPARCCAHQDVLGAGLWAGGALRAPTDSHPTWVQIAAAHHTLLMRLVGEPAPALQLVARLDQGGRAVDQRLSMSLSEALGRSAQSAQAAVVVMAARGAKELLCGGRQRAVGPLEHWVSLQLDGEYWEGDFTTDIERFQAPASAGPALDKLVGFVERAYRQLGLAPLDPERPRPQVVLCGGGNQLPGLRRLRRGLGSESQGQGVHVVELFDDADVLARGAALVAGLCHLEGGFRPWPEPPPPVEVAVEDEPDELPVPADPNIIDVGSNEVVELDAEPERLEQKAPPEAPPPVGHQAPAVEQPLDDLVELAKRSVQQVRDSVGGYAPTAGSFAPTSKPPPGRCRSCHADNLEWVFYCPTCRVAEPVHLGEAPRPHARCRRIMQLIRRCATCGSYS